MKLMNVTTYSCSDASLGCSCGDCDSSTVCSNSAPPLSQKTGSCSVRIGSLKARCIEFAVAIFYVLLVSVFLGWGFFHQNRERSPARRTKPLINVIDGGVLHHINRPKDENVPMQWNNAHKAGWCDCSLFLKYRSFCGLLLPNVPGPGYSWFFAWACIFACIFEYVWPTFKMCAHREARG